MSKTKLFIGSSKGSVSVARLVADRLENDAVAEVKVWDEGVFSLNQGFLETLVSILAEYDFAVFIWAPADITESKGESRASPRDNVVFECSDHGAKLFNNLGRVDVAQNRFEEARKEFEEALQIRRELAKKKFGSLRA
jgi:predicted nucleotide-binding protein